MSQEIQNTTPELDLHVIKLADLVGQFIQYWGFKKIHGEIWTLIWLSPEPIDATQLVKRLNVSKALVSLALKDLVEYDVVRVVGTGDRRKILLEANRDVQSVITSVLKNREAQLVRSVLETQTELENVIEKNPSLSATIDKNHLESMKMMTAMAEAMLSTLVQSNLDVKL